MSRTKGSECKTFAALFVFFLSDKISKSVIFFCTSLEYCASFVHPDLVFCRDSCDLFFCEFALVEFVKSKSLLNVNVADLAVVLADNDVGFACDESFCSCGTHFGGNESVFKRGAAAALYVSENAEARCDACVGFDLLSELFSVAVAGSGI